jgi:hypothetical protein
MTTTSPTTTPLPRGKSLEADNKHASGKSLSNAWVRLSGQCNFLHVKTVVRFIERSGYHHILACEFFRQLLIVQGERNALEASCSAWKLAVDAVSARYYRTIR